MKTLYRLTEADPKFNEGLIAHLGLVVVGDGLVEGEQGLDTAYHGLQVAQSSYREQHPAVVAWLESYAGNFDFYLSVRDQLRRKGSLSEAQTMAIYRAIQRDAHRAQPKPTAPQEFSIKPGDTLVLRAGFARLKSRELGFSRPLYAVDIIEVTAETPKAWKVKVKGSAVHTGCCVICGRSLTDPMSISANVGPICADKYGLSWGDTDLTRAELTRALEREVTSSDFWLPKSVVKERIAVDQKKAA